MNTARAKLLRVSPLFSSSPVERRSSGSSNPVEREQGALHPAHFAQGSRNAVLPRVRGELAQDHRRSDGAGTQRGDNTQDVGPVCTIRATLIRPPINGASVGWSDGLPKL